MTTTVVNIYHLKEGWQDDSQYVYIGREGKGQNGYFGNPFVIGKDGKRLTVIRKYDDYFFDRMLNDEEFFYHITRLEDKTLVCFCKPKICHGDIIAEFLNNGPYYSSLVMESAQDSEEHT